MSTPALTTAIVATETVHLAIPILVGHTHTQKKKKEMAVWWLCNYYTIFQVFWYQCCHEPVLPQGRLQVPQAEPTPLEEEALLHQGVGLLPGRRIPGERKEEDENPTNICTTRSTPTATPLVVITTIF